MKTMPMTSKKLAIPALMAGALFVPPALADSFSFSTGSPDGKMATDSRPGVGGKIEIESADDFVLTTTTDISSATFTGLITGTNPIVGEVRVEIYHVFPADSDTVRTQTVPTRANSPSDVELADRDTAGGSLTFTTTSLGAFSASNSVRDGIHPKPNQTTQGDGPVDGEEVVFTANFTTPFDLPPDHYFFVPQVQITGGEFFWLSAPKTIPAPGDLQSWIRNEFLAPDWLRVGTDIVGGATPPMFNATFSLTGNTVPEPSTWAMMLMGFAGLAFAGYRASRRTAPAYKGRQESRLVLCGGRNA
jgi:hypothetical protein